MVPPQLHRRSEYEDIRSAYDSNRSCHSDNKSEQSHSGSEKSCQLQPALQRPRAVHHNTCDSYDQQSSQFFPDRRPQESPSSSVETLASTIESEEELEHSEEIPEYDVPLSSTQPYEPRAVPATPSDFSELFPSHRRLTIRHDDSTLDGNMNLRLDTEVNLHGGRRCDMTLFHLRMHDLRNREFSLRRYCRDSGREVCHSARKQQIRSKGRPSLQRSLSNALNTIRPKSERTSGTLAGLKRNDSGYGSAHSSLDIARQEQPVSTGMETKTEQSVDRKSVKLEFSNYAQVEVTRAGVKSSKRYDFEYWGTNYAWKRIVCKDGPVRSTAYHLVKAGSQQVLAYIIPSRLTEAEAEGERSKGGWVPPCSMWIADESMVHGQKDVADVMIASGLIALVDDSIRIRFHAKDSQHMIIPKLQMGLEYVDPKRLINEMFGRDGRGTHIRTRSQQSSSS